MQRFGNPSLISKARQSPQEEIRWFVALNSIIHTPTFFYGNARLLLLVRFLRCVWNLKLGATKVADLQLVAVRLINSEMHKSVSRDDSLHPTYTFSSLAHFFLAFLLCPEKQGPLEDCCLSVQKMERRMPSIPRAG